jgi:DNA-binding beta-propeller fold protein YncE
VGLSIANVTSATSELLRPIRVGEFVDWSPDGQYISVVDYNGTVTIVDRATAATRAITGFPVGKQFWRPQWAADGSFVVMSDGSLYVVAPNANVAHRVDVGNFTVSDAAILPEP